MRPQRVICDFKPLFRRVKYQFIVLNESHVKVHINPLNKFELLENNLDENYKKK